MSFDKLEIMPDSMLYYCKALSQVSCPNLQVVNLDAFIACNNLKRLVTNTKYEVTKKTEKNIVAKEKIRF